MRILQLLALVLVAIAARADTFNITFTPTSTVEPNGPPNPAPAFSTGTLVTDGTCTTCSITQDFFDIQSQGIEDVQINHFNLGNPDEAGSSWGHFTFNVSTLALDGNFGVGDEFFTLGNGTYYLNEDELIENGTFIVSAVPEPSSLLLLSTVLLGVGRTVRRKIIHPIAVRLPLPE